MAVGGRRSCPCTSEGDLSAPGDRRCTGGSTFDGPQARSRSCFVFCPWPKRFSATVLDCTVARMSDITARCIVWSALGSFVIELSISTTRSHRIAAHPSQLDGYVDAMPLVISASSCIYQSRCRLCCSTILRPTSIHVHHPFTHPFTLIYQTDALSDRGARLAYTALTSTAIHSGRQGPPHLVRSMTRI